MALRQARGRFDMKRENGGTFLSAIFVDYDNIYLSLKRKSDEAAKRFAKDAPAWLKAIETGQLITPTNGPGSDGARRLVSNRCYGNPVPRRNASDNSTDMSSFPFVRHHFLRSGFEIIDCPPLTAQLKNSSDIRMVMDVRDYLTHATYFDEFIILSGDADFTPVLHRLRAHARRTVIFANDYTAAPYTAISDGEVREADLIKLLVEGRIGDREQAGDAAAAADATQIDTARRDILADVTAAVRASPTPVPLEVLADRAVRSVGHERTVGTAWAGAGSFRELIGQNLPKGLEMSSEPPYVVIDTQRHAIGTAQPALIASLTPAAHPIQPALAEPAGERIPARLPQPASSQPAAAIAAQMATLPAAQPAMAAQSYAPTRDAAAPRPVAPPLQPAPPTPPQQGQPSYAGGTTIGAGSAAFQRIARESAAQIGQQPPAQQPAYHAAVQPQPQLPPARPAQEAPQSNIQQSIARIHEACQAPPLAPPEYRVLFEVMAQEINENGLIGAQTILNIAQRAAERGVEIRRDDARFVLEVVSEADPWFEQGASANLFAGRFRNFVVARCRSQGLNLTADELDLIEAWFAAAPQQQARSAPATAPRATASQPPIPQSQVPQGGGNERWWNFDEQRNAQAESHDELPRIVRARQRG